MNELVMQSFDKVSYQEYRYFFEIFNFCLFYLQVGLADCSCPYDISTKIENRNKRKYKPKLIVGTDCKTGISSEFFNVL